MYFHIFGIYHQQISQLTNPHLGAEFRGGKSGQSLDLSVFCVDEKIVPSFFGCLLLFLFFLLSHFWRYDLEKSGGLSYGGEVGVLTDNTSETRSKQMRETFIFQAL